MYTWQEINAILHICLPGFKPFAIDFNDYYQTTTASGGGRQLLYKAVKLKDEKSLSIIDATGGWARDAFYLAKQGLKIKVIEQAEPVFRLLADAYQRGLQEVQLRPILANIELIHANAITLLHEGLSAQVIYLDPMFPERSKAAKVKKDLQILQNLPETVTTDPDELFKIARTKATARVVVKRPLKAPFLAGTKPSFQYLGKTVRFDVYT